MKSAFCGRNQTLIVAAVHGELDETAREDLRRHIERCDQCGAEWRFQSQMRDAMESSAAAGPPPLYFEGVLAEIHQRMPVAPDAARRRRSLFTIRRESFASAVMTGLAALWLLGGLWESSAVQGFLSRGTARSSSALMAAATPAQAVERATLVYIEGLGLQTLDTLKMLARLPLAQQHELGFDLAALKPSERETNGG